MLRGNYGGDEGPRTLPNIVGAPRYVGAMQQEVTPYCKSFFLFHLKSLFGTSFDFETKYLKQVLEIQYWIKKEFYRFGIQWSTVSRSC